MTQINENACYRLHRCVMRVLLVLLFLFLTQNTVTASDAVELEIPAVSTAAGEEFTLHVKAVNNCEFAAFTIEITYDSTIITPVSVSKNADLPGIFVYNNDYQSLGEKIRLVYADVNDYTGGGDIVDIVFKVNSGYTQPTHYTPGVQVRELINSELEDVPAVLSNDGIYINVSESDYESGKKSNEDSENEGQDRDGDGASDVSDGSSEDADDGSDVVVIVTPVPPPPNPGTSPVQDTGGGVTDPQSGGTKPSFADVPSDSLYYDAVEYLYDKGIVIGTGDGLYSPDDDVTRAQFVIIILRMFDIEIETGLDDNFSDCQDKYYTDYIATAKKHGLVQGVGDGMYAPERTVSREEAYTILHRVMTHLGKMPEIDAESLNSRSFADDEEVADWASDATGFFAGAGISLNDQGYLLPQKLVTRIEMAAIIYNLLTLGE